MVNTTRPELQETKTQSLPPAELSVLKTLREELCLSSKDFKLQSQQRFLRRILSPDNPVRNLLMVHGTGTGKTCTAVQVAEEFIIRPEFQDKKVLVLANPPVQDNFKKEIFNVDKLKQDPDGLFLSKQCTGRRYLEIVQRAQAEPIRLTDAVSREKVNNLANRIFGEFYEFRGYEGFANDNQYQKDTMTPNDYKKWIHETFDNRLIIVDEAHNLKIVTSETTATKRSAAAIEEIVKIANGVTLVLLTATPMYDRFEEIIYYFNLFLWNDRRIDPSKTLSVMEFFNLPESTFKEGQEERFRGFCRDYVSYIKGDNPFTFPFRLPPPDAQIAQPDRTVDHFGVEITKPRKYLKLTKSFVSPFQADAIKAIPKIETQVDRSLICCFPDYRTFQETFDGKDVYSYKKDVEKFLAPSKIGIYSSKFSLIMNILSRSTGIVYVYTNLVTYGAEPFAMCLEEHGYDNAIRENLLKNPSGETTRGSKGKYVLFTSDTSNADIRKAISRLKSPDNIDGSDIRVIIASPKVAEGLDFSFVRQINVLDPWFNMSRIEQVIGRGIRTCSHSALPFEYQNCTVYLHVCRYPKSTTEALDEYIYRRDVEGKAIKIAKVKRIIMESAMDCSLQNSINNLPRDWRNLNIPQIRSEDQKQLTLTLQDMAAPTFEDTVTDLVCQEEEEKTEKGYERPLSTILDIRDEVFDKLLKIFINKPIWSMDDLYKHPTLKQYSKNVLDYLIQNAVESQFQMKDKNGRIGTLRSTDNVLSLTFNERDTMLEKIIKEDKGSVVALPEGQVAQESTEEVADVNVSSKRESYPWPDFARGFEDEVLDWYIIDNVLTPKEKITHLLNLDWLDPPHYAKPLLAKMKDGRNMYIFGSKKIYNHEKTLIVPIGEEQDVYTKWLNEAKNRFLEQSDNPFASMKPGGIIFNIDTTSTTIKKAPRTKVIGGRMCTSYLQPILNAFVEWLNGEPFPESVKTQKDRCLYIDLLIRNSILQGKEGIFWVTPEEYEIFTEHDNSIDLIRRMK